MKSILLLLILTIILSACLPESMEGYTQPDWQYVDLRYIDPVDSKLVGTDLTAVYLREYAGEIQIRLDMLELDLAEAFDLQIAFKTKETSSISEEPAWDYWISARYGEAVDSWQTDGSTGWASGLRIVRDTRDDTITISLDKEPLQINRTGFKIGVFLMRPGDEEPLDSTAPISSNSPPPAPVPILFAFWNTLNAATPAQSMRAWDGAHSGPFYDRHGLKHLLQAASEWNIPITLLDLGDPRSLAALDFVGGKELVRNAVKKGFLSLPLTPGTSSWTGSNFIQTDEWVLRKAYQNSSEVRASSGLPGSRYLFNPDERWMLIVNEDGRSHPDLIIGTDRNKSPNELPVQCTNLKGTNILMLPNKAEAELVQQTTDSGLRLETRIALVNGAASLGGKTGYSDPCQGPVVFLGGDLTQSAWADPEAVQQGFGYITSRPWIHPISLAEIAAGKADSIYEPSQLQKPAQENLISTSGNAVSTDLYSPQFQNIILESIHSGPENVLMEAAWQMYGSLTAPALFENAAYYQLRKNYLGQIGYLLEGARWANQQADAVCSVLEYPGSDTESSSSFANGICTYTRDLDWDGQVEIMLTSEKFLAILEQEGGYLPALFYRDPDGVHQLVGPASQFATGLTDPMTWNLDQGAGVEPELPRGAFSDIREGWVAPSWEPLAYELGSGEVRFSTDDGSLLKTVALTEYGIRTTYQTESAFKVQNILALDPWQRYESGWTGKYSAMEILEGWSWNIDQGPHVELKVIKLGGSEEGSANIETELHSFLSVLPYANQPENPFIDYGGGYFLPFPLALVELEAEGAFEVQLSVTSEQ